MKNYDQNKLNIAQRYAESMIWLKVMKKISSGFAIGGGVLAALGVAAIALAPSIALVAAPIIFFLSLVSFTASIMSNNLNNQKLDSIAEEFNMSRKELKNFIKSEEMKEYLQYIFSDEYDSGVEQIESLSQTFKGKNPNYDKPISIVESIKKDIYEKKPNKR